MDNILIMKKQYLFLATAAIMMAGCASDDLVGDGSTNVSENLVIGFGTETPAVTRDGSATTDHGKLNDAFFVWGEKNEAENPSSSTSAENLVFKNYKVTWGDNTANTTLSNTKNWEYVGVTPVTSGISPNIGSDKSQTIKYWDMNATSYTFTAVSASASDIGSNVTITKTETGTDVYDKGYSITLKNGASTGDIYFADCVYIPKKITSNGSSVDNITTTNEEAKYGGYVKFTFRNFQTKIRFGFYETVPGYKVQVKNVTYGNTTKSTTNFGVNSKFYSVPTEANSSITYNVVYEDGNNGTTANKATVEVGTGATPATSMAFGSALMSTEGVDLATSSATPTYDQTNGAYTSILPNPKNDADMTFKISYTLISEDTGEKIEVTDKDVTVPAEYCQWKPNYAYTYLFKISDQSADLYPITFDACVVEDETGKQETITELGGDTKSTSITTFAYDANSKKIVESDKGEYPAGSEIYATVLEGSSNITLDATTSNAINVKLYTVTTTNATNYPVTEKSVAKAFDTSTYPVTGTANIKATEADANTYKVRVVESVPAEDGVGTRSISALTWTDNTTSTGTTYYAIQYTNTANELCYKVVKVVKN